ncbi:hypothetical protein DPMN_193380 [Dreissena polymorpha]|uniref:Uncharacterized protein n=1 Tax=Dreissena polymorpha TaxID=45954 RepID=A0A9D4BFP1_DREPO|nr:hypothetical protein DPMN_193380 [Dreissena polymorpha]
MSVRRRYLLRPFLIQKYSSICNINTPITSNLFGDDVSKELKKCATSVRVGKYPMIKPTSVGHIRGRRGRWRARTYGRGTNSSCRQAAVTDYGQFGHKHDFKSQKKSSTTAPKAPN